MIPEAVVRPGQRTAESLRGGDRVRVDRSGLRAEWPDRRKSLVHALAVPAGWAVAPPIFAFRGWRGPDSSEGRTRSPGPLTRQEMA